MKENWELLYNQTREAAENTKGYADSLKHVMNVFIKTLDQANDIIVYKEVQIETLKKSIDQYDKEVKKLQRRLTRLN
jgi:hypothetical protein